MSKVFKAAKENLLSRLAASVQRIPDPVKVVANSAFPMASTLSSAVVSIQFGCMFFSSPPKVADVVLKYSLSWPLTPFTGAAWMFCGAGAVAYSLRPDDRISVEKNGENNEKNNENLVRVKADEGMDGYSISKRGGMLISGATMFICGAAVETAPFIFERCKNGIPVEGTFTDGSMADSIIFVSIFAASAWAGLNYFMDYARRADRPAAPKSGQPVSTANND